MKVSQEQWDLKPAHYGIFWRYIQDDEITDINYDGRKIWIDHLKRGTYEVKEEVSASFLKQFAQRVSNVVSSPFNKYHPLLEAETDILRISMIHEEVTNTGMAISIRKTPVIQRLNKTKLLQDKYCTLEILEFLERCVKGHLTLLICGLPGSGKTELLKFLTGFIPRHEKVITIEDNLEIHLSCIKPMQNCVELKVDSGQGKREEGAFTYTDGIKAYLRQNPKWVILSEARSSEVKYLIESLSTGLHGMTTLHTDDVRKVPDRIQNMAEDMATAQRLKNDVFSFVDVGILVRKTNTKDGIYRWIDQICFFERNTENGKNTLQMIAEEGIIVERGIPYNIKKKTEEYLQGVELFNDLTA